MQRKTILAYIAIILIVSLAVASVAIRNIRLSAGSNVFERAGSGPLGLTLGLDLKGGSYLVYQSGITNPSAEQMEGVASVIERRVNAFGVTEPVIQRLGDDRLVVQLPGVKNIEEAKKLIGQTARLEFKLRECEDAFCAKYEDKDAGGLTGDHLTRAFAGRHQTTGEPIVNIQFDSKGTEIFAELTKRMAGDPTKRIAIFLDQQELLAPVVQSQILTGSGFISGGDFTPDRVRTIAIQLESGRLPVPLKLIEESDIDALLGSTSLSASLKAGAISLGLIILFMVVYYRMAGALAGLALLMYGVVVLAIFKMLPVTLTLPGIAGFIISLGMAVDANVLIFERMKEELRAGRPLISAIDAGFNRAWSAIWDSNVTTFITCAILYWFGSRTGTAVVSGFAFTLFIGVATSMFSAIFVSKNLLHLAARSRIGKWVNLFTPEPLARPAGAETGGED